MTTLAGDKKQLTRTCVHCVLGRVLRRETETFAARGLQLSMGQSEAVWLPESGQRLYRRLHRLVRTAALQADSDSPLKIVVHDLCGKSHVEVTASFRASERQEVLGCALPRYVLRTLWLGFEGDSVTR